MNRNKLGRLSAVALLLTLPAVAPAQDDFDKLLKEIGGAPAPAAAPAAQKPAVEQPQAAAPAAPQEELSLEERKKQRELRADIKAALAPPDAKTVDDAKLMAQQEEVRKQALEAKARKDLEKGTKALRSGNYEDAIKMLEETVRNMPVRPATEAIMEGAKAALGQAYLAKGNAILEASKKKGVSEAIKDLETAKDAAELARRQMPANPEVENLVSRISAAQSRLEVIRMTPVKVTDRPEYAKKQKDVRQLLDEARQYYAAKDYNNAEATYAQALQADEYNTEAMRYLRKIDEIRYDLHSMERDATVAGMMDDVRKTWTPPRRQEIKLGVTAGSQTNIYGKTVVLQQKLSSWIIPEINFRAANIHDVVEFLVQASREADPERNGVNIILNLNTPGAAPAPSTGGGIETRPGAEGADLLAPATLEAPGLAPAAGASLNVPNITLNLRRASVLAAVKYICEVAGLHYRLEENAVIITPANVVVGTVITRLYPVQSTIFETTIGRAAEENAADRGGGGGGTFIGMEGGNTSMQREDVRAFFEKAGVPFPAGTSITYNSQISKLIVANTPDNLEKLEQILAALQITPSQVEIEARFVELNQNDLKELGLEWILTDNYEIATQKGTGTIGSQPAIVAKADTLGLSKGLNFFTFDSSSGLVSPNSAANQKTGIAPLGNILSIAGVLTNPELTAVIHALDQHGAADVLSAPRVTTRSGVNAQIQVVREIIYPTEFETTQPQFSTGSFSGSQVVTPPLVTPGSFETREVGVILNATPTVQPDGYSIDLVLAPEVSELEGWINYGSTFGDFVFNIPQPIFNTRKVTTTMVIWDGQTVVMGGLIREQLLKTKDKIPFLGDLPLLGRLFRSEGEYSQKKNLMIFVTARLVDPAGKPIHSADSLEAAPTAGPNVTPAPQS